MLCSRTRVIGFFVLLGLVCCQGITLRAQRGAHRNAENPDEVVSRVSGLAKPRIVQPWHTKKHHMLFRAGDRDEPECECVGHGLPEISGLTEDAPGTLAMNGPYVKRTGEDGKATYLPHSYGSECKAWEMELDKACKSNYPPAYCSQKWCYVKEDCAVKDTKQSLYFPEKKLYFSYNNCGSFDAFTSMACFEKGRQDNCQDPCAWNGRDGVCQNALCQCTGDNKLSGAKALKFGDDYGETCSAWDKQSCEEDYGDSKSALGLWCCKRWCYVEDSCPSAKPSAVQKGLFYSYFACPDNSAEIAQCPWKKPVDFSGELLPLTPEARKALENPPKRSSAGGRVTLALAAVAAVVASLF